MFLLHLRTQRRFIYPCDNAHSAVCRAQREWESQKREDWTLFSSLDGSTHSVVANFLSTDPKGKKYTFDPFRWTFNMLYYERGSLNATIASKRLSDQSEERIFQIDQWKNASKHL